MINYLRELLSDIKKRGKTHVQVSAAQEHFHAMGGSMNDNRRLGRHVMKRTTYARERVSRANEEQRADQWPPVVTVEQLLNRTPPRPPYITRPPLVIDISVGRQLFVDDYLIMNATAQRTFHRAKSRGIVLKPESDDAMMQNDKYSHSSVGFRWVSTARPFSGGVWHDGCRFIMHYRCRYAYTGHGQGCIAFSDDGVHWVKPRLSLNRTLRKNRGCSNCSRVEDPPNLLNFAQDCEAFTTWLDHADPDPAHRWKAVVRTPRSIDPMMLWSSADGVRWTGYRTPIKAKTRGVPDGRYMTGQVTDRATFFYNPFRRRWAFSLRENLCRGGHGHMRISRIKEVQSLHRAEWPNWVESYFQCGDVRGVGKPVRWIGVDEWDCEGKNVQQCDLYHVDATAYESLMVGQFAVLYPGVPHGGCKSSHVHVAFSRDGFHWTRAEASQAHPRKPLVDDPLGLQYSQPVAGNMLVVGDEIYVYYTGATNCKRCNFNPHSILGKGGANGSVLMKNFCTSGHRERDGVITPANSSMEEVTALAILRRDGFASLETPEGRHGAYVITRPLTFSRGRYLFVNVDASSGEFLVAVDRVTFVENDTSVVEILRSVPLKGVNTTRQRIQWSNGRPDLLASFEGGRHRFRLRFIFIRKVHLFSFWVASDWKGHSNGHIGGPHFGRGVDSVNVTIPKCKSKIALSSVTTLGKRHTAVAN